MRISASVRNSRFVHVARVETSGQAKKLRIPRGADGRGAGVNGGELLMLALATCYCNDIYREAERRGMTVSEVEVRASADFEGVGLAATNVTYRARVKSPAPREEVERLLRETDAVAEIQNTVRSSISVTLEPWDATA
jgi:organic hydroperoxide reductase OsmC/OhrA